MQCFSLAFLTVAISAWAQTSSPGPIVIGVGSSNPYPAVAPGQLLTIFVQTASGAQSTSATVSAVFLGASGSEDMPVLQVAQTKPLAVTFQIPFDIATAPATSTSPSIELPPSYVDVSINNAAVPSINVAPVLNHVHILTSCDTIIGGGAAIFGPVGSPCPPLIVHADGRPVSAILPAKSGEELIAYATGLGQTNPSLTTGQPAAESAPTVAQFNLDFNYRANALATAPGAIGAAVVQPLFSGATKGFVGLYQVNFIVPPPPAGSQPCVDFAATPATGSPDYVVRSNLTVSVGSDVSFDGAGICVTPGS